MTQHQCQKRGTMDESQGGGGEGGGEREREREKDGMQITIIVTSPSLRRRDVAAAPDRDIVSIMSAKGENARAHRFILAALGQYFFWVSAAGDFCAFVIF